MREILFRGQRIDNGEWVFGDYTERFRRSSGNIYHHIQTRDIELSCGTFPVDPKTVGQYTGLDNKNGNKIFEGDIIKWDDDDTACEVFYRHAVFMTRDVQDDNIREFLGELNLTDCEIIGNVFDNPELLEVAK